MQEVAKVLSEVEDKTLQNQLGTKVFGTLWEENGTNITDTILNMNSHLTTTAENTAVTDAVGATIMTLWNAVAANLSGTNALFSTDLYAAQSGSEKEVASSSTKITTSTYEVLEATANKLALAKTPIKDSIKEICLLHDKSSVGYIN